MSINLLKTVNGWIVEVWRAKTAPREQFVYTDDQFDEMMQFVRDTAQGG